MPSLNCIMIRNAIVVGLLCWPLAFEASARKAQNGIIEKRNVPLAVTVFMPANNPGVRTRIRLAGFALQITPYVSQSFDRTKTTLGIDVKTTTSESLSFSFAGVVVTADGKQLGSVEQDWVTATSFAGVTEETTIEDSALVHNIATAKEVYLTVVVPGRPTPFNQISFKLSPQQLDNVRLLADKYDAMERPSQGP